jgi:haloalkane dehalogenase
VESVERFRGELGVERCVPVVHDWGGLIGLRWACEHPDAVAALVISSTGFFPDGKWHGMASALRTPGTGEELVDGLDRDGFAAVLRSASRGIGEDAIDEYWKSFADTTRRRGQLELYRSATSRSSRTTASPTSACRRCCSGARATSSRRWPCAPLRARAA